MAMVMSVCLIRILMLYKNSSKQIDMKSSLSTMEMMMETVNKVREKKIGNNRWGWGLKKAS
jgi:hypothetical protein